ncbi:caspase domain-containing protein [Amycolatopsis sp. cmx-11-12]|uniref:caspase family protein n=1 Tax=Amycolatopsis sp. cmx-11-12 TaxID=2785795 RepID=UPI00391835ED
MIDYGNSRAVLIGMSRYDDEDVPDVPSAVNSVQGLRELLIDPALCGWPEDRVTVIENPPTASKLARRLYKLAEETTATLLVYFVGHGALSKNGDLCLVVGETEIAHPDLTGLAFNWVRSAVLDSPAKSKIVILDCCYSGRAIPALAGEDDQFANVAEIRGAYTLTASDSHARTPPAGEKRCTLFTEAFLEVVRKGLPGDLKVLTFSDIYQELWQRLMADGLPRPNQRGTHTMLRYPFSRNAAVGLDIEDYADPPPPVAVEAPSRTRRRALVIGSAVLAALLIVVAIVWAPWRKDEKVDLPPPAPAATSSRATPAAAPGNLGVARNGGQVAVSWTAPDLAGGQLVHYLVSGTGLAERSVTTTETTYTDVPVGANLTFTVRAITRTATGQQLTGASAAKSLTTPASPTIIISRGADTSSAKCEKPDCSWIDARLTGFRPHTSYQVVPVGNGRVFSEPCEATTDGNGSATCDDVRYDVPGADVYEYVETSDGVIKSNVIHWERR